MRDEILLEGVLPVVKYAADQFCRRHHRRFDPEEVYGEATLAAVEAVRSHDRDRSPVTLGTWVHVCVQRRLAAKNHSRLWRERVGRKVGSPLSPALRGRPHFSLGRLLFEVGREAARAIRLALDTGLSREELKEAAHSLWGWEWAEVNRVWEEVREALQ